MIHGPLVTVDAIVADLSGRDATSVFTELCTPLSRSEGVARDELVAALVEREALASTAVGDGVAMPHGVHAGLHRVATSFGRSREGLAFGAPDAEPVHLFVTLVRPPDAVNAHLKALARWSQILVGADVRRALLDAGTAEEMLRILTSSRP